MSAVVESHPAKHPRLVWLDLFRGVAVILMIETHSVNSFLLPGLRQTGWFAWLNFFNGLVAPSFLFIAGYTQGLAMRRRADRAVAWKRIRRLLTIALIGYALHFPWTAHLFNRETMRTMLQVDILQCLAVSLLALLAIAHFARFSEGMDVGISALFAAVILVAPRLANWNAESLWMLPFAAFVNQQTGSLFPLFPWMSFALAGALASRIPLCETESPANFPTAFLGCGAAAGLVVWSDGFGAWPAHQFNATNPGFFFQRLALLLAFVPCFVWLQNRVSPRLLVFAGRESLALYVIHLLVLYGVFFPGGSLAARIGCTQSPVATAGMFAILLAVSLALTSGFSTVKGWKKT